MVVLPLLSPNFQVLPLIWNCGISLSFQLLSLPFSHAVFLHLCFYVSKPDVYLKLLVIIKKKGALIVFFPFLTLKQTDCCVSASEWLSIKARTCVLGCLFFFYILWLLVLYATSLFVCLGCVLVSYSAPSNYVQELWFLHHPAHDGTLPILEFSYLL